MKKDIAKKVILSTSLLLMGAAATQLPESPVQLSSEAKAYNIGQDVTDINELTKYYTQTPEIYSYKWLRQRDEGPDKGNIYADFTHSWYAHIKVWGPESWGNINKMRNSYVDIFGIREQETFRYFWIYQDTYTGGVTPAATSAHKNYALSLKLNDKNGNTVGVYQFYTGNKPVLSLKEADFRIRQALINHNQLYKNGQNAGEIKITSAGKTQTIDLSKRLHSDRANHFVESPQNAIVEVNLK